MLRPLRITCEIIASLIGIIVLLALFLAWRLAAGPMQATFLTPTIESSIESLVTDTQVSIAHTLLAWDDSRRSIILHADQVQIRDKAGRVIAEVPEFDTELSLIGMLVGQFLPEKLIVDRPRVRLERQADGAFTFGGMTTNGPDNAPGSAAQGENFKQSLAHVADQLAHTYFLRRLSVDHAVFDVHDNATNSDWSVNIPEISLAHAGRDLTGQAVVDVAQQDHTATVNVLYTYDRHEDLHRLVSHVNEITPAFFAGGHPATLGLAQAAIVDLPLSGDIGIAFDSDMNIAAANLVLHGGAGTLNDPALWDNPRKVKALDLTIDYDRDEGLLTIPSGMIDFGGPRATLTGKASPHDLLKPSVMDFTLTIKLDGLSMDEYGNLWPKTVISGAREWIAANLTRGQFDHAEANLAGTLNVMHLDATTLTDATGTVSATNGRVQYMDGMPPVEGVNAQATFDMNQLTAQLSGGGIGAIKVMPFALTITNFQDDVQNINIPLKIAGPIPDILRLIDHPPLGYTHSVGLKPEDVSGDTLAQVNFRFPLLNNLSMKDVGITATANLANVASTKLVKGINVTQGSLALTLDTESFEIKGPALINAIPLDVDWQQSFDSNSGKPLQQAMLGGTVTAEQFAALGISAFNGTKGPMKVSLQMTEPTHGKMLFTGSADMTAAEVHVDQLNWKKPAQVSATGLFAAEKQGDEINITSIELHGPQLNVKGNASLTQEGELEALSLTPMIIGRTNASLHFTRPDEDNSTLHFDAEGEALDVSGFASSGSAAPQDAPQPPSQPKEFRINVGKLYTSADGFIAHADGYAIRDGKGWSEISLHGLADGGHALDVNLQMQPSGGRVFSITCDDFGKALKGLGFADKVRGGALDIHGSSDPEDPRAINGTISVGSFTVGNLPMLAVLMNAASPFGFAGLFTGSMDFSSIHGNFRWEGDDIRVSRVHAAGAAVGINIAGLVDLNSNAANLHGTMVPFSAVNSVIGAIPLIGDLFTGGKGEGVFAVSYTIKGAVDKPDISVNPVSLLTPGILRTLFFGSSDDEDEMSDEKASKP